MKLENKEARLFYMGFNPDSERNTIRVEIELTDEEFNDMKHQWADTSDCEVTMRI